MYFFTDPDDPYKLNQDTRMLGLVVCRGTSVVLICPVDGMEAIPNPFVQQEGWLLVIIICNYNFFFNVFNHCKHKNVHKLIL